METQFDTINKQILDHFMKQGRGIDKLYGSLNSNIVMHHLRKWLSIIVESGLYLLFLSLLALAIWIPSELSLSYINEQGAKFSASYTNDEISRVFSLLSFVMILFSLSALIFAIFLGRNRKKNNLIREAFTEVKKLKTDFDGIARDLRL